MSNAPRERLTRDQLSTLHEGLVVELDKRLGRSIPPDRALADRALADRALADRALADRSGELPPGEEPRMPYLRRPLSEPDSGINDTLKWIERASSVVATMQETIKAYEDTIYELRQKAGDIERDRDEAYRQLAAAEKIMRSEADRAARSERTLQTLDGRHKQLENDYALLKSNIDGLLRLVNPQAE